jgi:hypothetical protein
MICGISAEANMSLRMLSTQCGQSQNPAILEQLKEVIK